MELKVASRHDVIDAVVTQLGFDETIDFMSEEFLASAVRYAASVVCPTSPRNLISVVVQSMQSIACEDDLRQCCKNVLDDVIATGDLVESEDITSGSGNRLLYLAPPFFVRLSKTQALVLGVAPDGVNPIPDDVRLALRGVNRVIDGVDDPSVAQVLKLAGIEELPYRTWAKSPDRKHYQDVINQYDRLIDRRPDCGNIEDFSVLRWDTQNRWYRKRWGDSGRLTGRFVARRPRKYGADLWCYVELENGAPRKLVDLPIGRTAERGCDQAWRLQCAIDAMRGAPQQYRVMKVDGDTIRVAIHIPPPAWLLRRWKCIGRRAADNVFAFEFTSGDALKETEFLEQELWMESCEN